MATRKRKNPAAVALGRKGGKVGGHARAAGLSKRRRRAIARLGGLAAKANREKGEKREAS